MCPATEGDEGDRTRIGGHGQEATKMEVQGMGFTLGRSRIRTTTPPNKARAIFRARKALEEFVYDATRHRGESHPGYSCVSTP